MQSPIGISVLVLSYQHSTFIEKCIKGIQMQDFEGPLEIVVADDASNDGTSEKIRTLAAADKRIKALLNEQNIGVARNFAHALAHCTQQLIAFCEGDDYWTDPQKLSLQYKALTSHPDLGMSYTNYAKVDTTGRVIQEAMLKKQPVPFTLHDLLHGHGPSTNTILMRRNAFPAKLPPAFFTVPNPDVFYMAFALCQGPGQYLPRICSAYRQHEGGIWSSLDAKKQKLIRLSTRLEVLKYLNISDLKEERKLLHRELIALLQKIGVEGHPEYIRFSHWLSSHQRWQVKAKKMWIACRR